jgi:prepilin-type N-terminal cleavage/methylation domain-containing protein/prepilin-type processing-associated H-X9-DG protein
MERPVPRHAGFTLVELLVVIAIIIVLAGMIMASAWQARLKALQASCLNSMRQLGMSNLQGGTLGAAGECPMGAQYATNKYVHRQYEVNDLTGTVMLFESHEGDEGDEYDVWPIHLGGSNYVFWDGHAKWSKAIPRFKP